MLAGDPPFSEGGLGERVYKHLHTEPPDIRGINPDVPPGLWAVLKRMLAKAPGARYQTPAELLRDLLHLPTKMIDGTADRPEPPASARRTAKRREPAAPPESSDDGVSAGLDEDEDSGLSTPEQRLAATRQFERASEVAAAGENEDYARHLLLSCCQLDPANLRYRQALRQLKRKRIALLGRLTAPLGKLAGKARLQAALRKGEYLKVLEQGEEAVAAAPKDIAVHLLMVDAAAALGLPRLASWLAEQARAGPAQPRPPPQPSPGAREAGSVRRGPPPVGSSA